MKSFKYLAIYFCIMLLFPKAISYFDLTKELYIYLIYIVALLFSYKYVKHIGFIPISIFAYLTLFSIDLITDLNFITSDKTESFIFGIGASVLFAFPMTIGLLVRRVIENLKEAR